MTAPSPVRNGLPQQLALWRDNCGEASTGDWADRAAGVLRNEGLLIRVQPGGRVDDKAGRFQRVLPDVDFGLFGEKIAPEGSRIHRRMNLFAVGHERVSCQWNVVFPACQLSHAPNGTIDSSQSRTVALAPDHALMVGRRQFAAMLDQRAVRIEKQLSIVDRSAIALIDANGRHHACLPASFTDRECCRRRHCHCLLEQYKVLPKHFKWPLHVRKIGIVRYDCLREGRELYTLATKLDDFLDDPVNGPLAAVEDRADLHCGRLDDGHARIPSDGF